MISEHFLSSLYIDGIKLHDFTCDLVGRDTGIVRLTLIISND